MREWAVLAARHLCMDGACPAAAAEVAALSATPLGPAHNPELAGLGLRAQLTREGRVR